MQIARGRGLVRGGIPVLAGWNGKCGKKFRNNLIPIIMTPIDPAQAIPPNRRSATAPPYVDEDPNLALVQQGLEVAEDEKRDAVADAYEASALESDDPSETMDDIDFLEGEEPSSSPELAAMHEEVPDLSNDAEDEDDGK